jgi:hypothetical protein
VQRCLQIQLTLHILLHQGFQLLQPAVNACKPLYKLVST